MSGIQSPPADRVSCLTNRAMASPYTWAYVITFCNQAFKSNVQACLLDDFVLRSSLQIQCSCLLVRWLDVACTSLAPDCTCCEGSYQKLLIFQYLPVRITEYKFKLTVTQYGISQITSYQCSRPLANCFPLSWHHQNMRATLVTGATLHEVLNKFS